MLCNLDASKVTLLIATNRLECFWASTRGTAGTDRICPTHKFDLYDWKTQKLAYRFEPQTELLQVTTRRVSLGDAIDNPSVDQQVMENPSQTQKDTHQKDKRT